MRVVGRVMQLLRIKIFMISMWRSFSANSHNILSVSRTPYLLDQFAISSEFKVNHEYIRSALIFLISVEITKVKGKYQRPCHSFVEQIDVTFCGKIEEI